MTDQANIRRLMKEQAVQQNRVTAVKIEGETIYVSIESEVAGSYERSDCAVAVKVEKHDSEIVEVQGLGLQGGAVRYLVKRQRVAYLNDAGQFVTFTLAIPGIRLDLLVTEEVAERTLYLLIDCHFSFSVTVALLNKLDQVQTSDSALEGWRKQSAAALPSVGELIQALNQKKDQRLAPRRV